MDRLHKGCQLLKLRLLQREFDNIEVPNTEAYLTTLFLLSIENTKQSLNSICNYLYWNLFELEIIVTISPKIILRNFIFAPIFT